MTRAASLPLLVSALVLACAAGALVLARHEGRVRRAAPSGAEGPPADALAALAPQARLSTVALARAADELRASAADHGGPPMVAAGQPAAVSADADAEEPGSSKTVGSSAVSREVRALTDAMTTDLEKIGARHPGAAVTFVDCGQAPCAARLQAPDARLLHEFVSDVSAVYGGHVSIDMREHLDGYTGHWYEADLAVGTEDPEGVPTFESSFPATTAP
jgi:hypothetical protein